MKILSKMNFQGGQINYKRIPFKFDMDSFQKEFLWKYFLQGNRLKKSPSIFIIESPPELIRDLQEKNLQKNSM